MNDHLVIIYYRLEYLDIFGQFKHITISLFFVLGAEQDEAEVKSNNFQVVAFNHQDVSVMPA